MTGWRLGAAIGPEDVIDIISKFNTNIESCTTHFIQRGMVEAINGDSSGPEEILRVLKARRDVAVVGLNEISGISITAPASTFYLFPNVTEIMERKGLSDVNDLMTGALHNSNVSFCTRNHFGRPDPADKDHYIRFAYSGINEQDIKKGLRALKVWFEQP
jgi:aspartate/methionine/tyrosine aminotransferase